MGKGSLSWKHPLSLVFGFYTDDRLTKATDYTDLIIAIGYDGVEYSAKSWNREKKPVIHIDTLYSETDIHYPIQGELVGDIAANLENLLGKVYPRNQLNPFYSRLREENLLEQKELAEDLTFPVKPQKLVFALRSVLKGKDMAVVDVGAHKVWMGRLYPADIPQTCLISNGFASMGVALPGAIAAKMVYPDRNVVAVCGDGALQMNIQEMETAFRLKLPIVILVWRDGGYGLIDWEQKQKGYPTASVRFENPDLVRLAEAYGGKGLRLEKTDELISVLEKALHMDVPVLVDCPVDYSENMKLTERIQFKGDG